MTRIDKFLWAVRLHKTRSMAANDCKNQKVLIQDVPVKSSRIVRVGEVIQIKKQTAVFSYKILNLLENRVGAPLVKDYIEDITTDDQRRRYEEYLLAQREYNSGEFGKPSKSDRRKIRRFLGG